MRRYPTGLQYRDALYNADLCFKDPALKGGSVTTDQLGMPKLRSGNFASVCTVRGSSNQKWGVKCFTRFVDHQEARYQFISEALRSVKKPWRVEFDYLPEGVLCEGHWYPALKMEWIEAIELIPFIEKHLQDPAALADLAIKFARMVEDLAALGIAHGDLQHGNLLVTPSGELKLVDYDGMYVPSLAKMGACEFGHRNYQSPARTLSTWGPYLDNFSALVIYSSLVALTIEPTLWTLLRDQGDEALLFKKSDFGDQQTSRTFQVLSHSHVADLKALGLGIKALWEPDVRTIPRLDPSSLPTPNANSTTVMSPQPGPVSSPSTVYAVPDWVTQVQGERQPGSSPAQAGAGWIAGHLPTLPLVPFEPSRVPVRITAGLALAVFVASGILTAVHRVSLIMVGPAAGIVLFLFFAISYAIYRRTSECREKRGKARMFRDRKADAGGRSREVSRIERLRRDVEGRKQKELARATKQAEKAKSSEQRELAGANKRLQAQIGNLEKQRQRLSGAETSETGRALRTLQRDHVARYMSNHLISSAGISGIGPGVVRSLATNGIRSAADFTGIQYQTGPRGGQQICIRSRHGLVHPSGVGEKKARDLEAWRLSIEHQAMQSQPGSLPQAQLQAIQRTYTTQRQALADQERTTRAQAVQEQQGVALRWASEHARISGELSALHRKFAQELAQVDVQLVAARKEADTSSWHLELSEREVTAYRKVNYRRYLVRIV